MVLSHLAPIEHGVEGGHLIHADLRHVKNLCHAVHGSQAEPAFVLLLRNVQDGDAGGGLVVGRVPGDDVSNLMGNVQQ